MPRPKPLEPNDRTVLFRITARQQEVLESIAHLEETTPNEYVHQLLVADLGQRSSDPFVETDLRNRAAYRAAATGRVSPLRRQRQGADEVESPPSTTA